MCAWCRQKRKALSAHFILHNVKCIPIWMHIRLACSQQINFKAFECIAESSRNVVSIRECMNGNTARPDKKSETETADIYVLTCSVALRLNITCCEVSMCVCVCIQHWNEQYFKSCCTYHQIRIRNRNSAHFVIWPKFLLFPFYPPMLVLMLALAIFSNSNSPHFPSALQSYLLRGTSDVCHT